jgi:protein SCO1/2
VARVRLALLTLTACLAAAVIGVVLAQAGRSDSRSAPGFEGALRPADAPAGSLAGLADEQGRPVALPTRGVAVVTFVYSHCRDVCPAQVQSIRGALDDLGHDVPAFAISVDPAQDTAASARAFLIKQHVLGRVHFVLGPVTALRRVWRTYGIAPQRGPLDHSAYTVIVRDGHQRIGFPADHLTAEGLAHDVARLS